MLTKSTVAVAVALLAAFVAAQQQANITFDPSTIDSTTRSQWCQAEFNTCQTLCSGKYNSNTCDPTSLNYTCLCAANNSAPGLQFYTQTMDTFVCEENFALCNADAVNEVNSAEAQAACKATEQSQCGHLDPTNFTSSAVSSSSSSTTAAPTSSSTAAGTGTGAATSSSSKGAAATMVALQNFGTGAFAVGAAAVFGALL